MAAKGPPAKASAKKSDLAKTTAEADPGLGKEACAIAIEVPIAVWPYIRVTGFVELEVDVEELAVVEPVRLTERPPTLMVPENDPAAVGWKLIVMVHELPGASEEPQVEPETVNAGDPEMLGDDRLALAVPWLLSTVLCVLVPPEATLPKLTLVGLREREAVPANADPELLINAGIRLAAFGVPNPVTMS